MSNSEEMESDQRHVFFTAPELSDEALQCIKNYFENKQQPGGGDCEISKTGDDVYKIRFEEKARERVLEQKDHTIAGPGEEKICALHSENKKEGQTTASAGVSTNSIDTKSKLVFNRLRPGQDSKLTTADVLELSPHSLQSHACCAEEELVETFLQKLLMMNYRVRELKVKDKGETDLTKQTLIDSTEDDSDFFADMPVPSEETRKSEGIHPMDVQMAVFHYADGFLKQLMVTKLSQCQYALPLLVPDPFTQKIEFPLWTFRQIQKSWKIRNNSNETIIQTHPICKAETPMVFFFRFGAVSSSKSELMNRLINEKHNTFFHRHCPGSTRTRELMEGGVEIAWYCPSGTNDDKFNNFVAFCNLHGDAGEHEEQLRILSEMASVNVVLLEQLNRENRYGEVIQNLYKQKTALVCLVNDESGLTQKRKGKFRIGLKDRNHSDVSEELTRAINNCLSESSANFRLEDLAECSDIRVDEEEDEDCRRGRAAAQKMMGLLEKKHLSEIKESFLPHQGKLWHQWSQKNKDLHRPYGNELEMEISLKQTKLREIRGQQHRCQISEFTKIFLKEINTNKESEKKFFLKQLRILLDEHTSDDLQAVLQSYNRTWSGILELKKMTGKSENLKQTNTQRKLKAEQETLLKISKELQASTFGVEHIMREIGQIFECCSFLKENPENLPVPFSDLPSLAAEMMISGFPLELMDGDAAHVPLLWISAVLEKLKQKLGDQTRVFVLSVLGLQSSGKSTMLNAMFGLQFAISAGRCTRGAFMQLVKVSAEMKTKTKFDYILVVDTEGLRAQELAGRSTRNHDNELATFIVGIANLTLINIFGENLAEMQDVLQIVVHAFMRMRKVNLKPSCVFVHQNVSDLTAAEKNMEGRRLLQETLDEMTKIAAKDEDSNAESFSDIIKFDVQKDVWYFTQLWEGSPPMAPPNPKYCRHVQELRNTILSRASESRSVNFHQLKQRVSDLWNALLNENFVFSFKNILEIVVYRSLEDKYSDWTWKLRSAMLKVEEKFQNRIENGRCELEESDLFSEMSQTQEDVRMSVIKYFEEDKEKETLSQWRARFERNLTELHEDLIKRAKRRLDEVIQRRKARYTLDAKRSEYESKLFCHSKELALQLKNNKTTSEQEMKSAFDSVWSSWITELVKDIPPVADIDFWKDAIQILSENLETPLIHERYNLKTYKQMIKGDYSEYIVPKKNLSAHGHYSTKRDASSKHQEQEERTSQTSQKKVSKLSQFVSFVTKPFQAFRGWAQGSEQNEPQSENQTISTKPKHFLDPEDEKSLRSLVKDVVEQSWKVLQQLQGANVGYNISYLQEMKAVVQQLMNKYQQKNSKFKLAKSFVVDLCLHVCDLAHDKCNERHKKYKDANNPKKYLEQQRPQYYQLFQNYVKGATNTAIAADLLGNKLESSILQAVYNKTVIDLADLMRSDFAPFSGNRSNLEKHILKTLAKEEDFQKYIEYIQNPKHHFEQFITCEVDKFIKENPEKVLSTFRKTLSLKEEMVNAALSISIQEVKQVQGDADMWQRKFSENLTDEMKFSGNSFLDLKEITDLDFLFKILRDGLTEKISQLKQGFTNVDEILDKCRKKPDEYLMDHICHCCWVQCPFCGAICTNTIENHDGDHSVPFHRNNGLNGWFYRGTTNLSINICTSAVASDRCFYPNSSDETVSYKDYRKAGGVYSTWSITPDLSELPYWKWFVCRYQTDLEKYYKKTFDGSGKIPDEWRKHSREAAIKSLDDYI
ncbi:hypothetical protein DNTS_004346 [Danionella cerebrum]|uniref:VLIG-type G domain-containing protein n=1 Tax=Danionella cerebrum TaxID=2873325 RepID=A0A553P913_9TELE|nr:hypothetical protein DNTS_004346 [Danionella translucida]